MRLPWRPREYQAIVEALREAELALDAANAVHGAGARQTRRKQDEVRTELTKRTRGT